MNEPLIPNKRSSLDDYKDELDREQRIGFWGWLAVSVGILGLLVLNALAFIVKYAIIGAILVGILYACGLVTKG